MQDGRLTARQLVQAYLARIEAFDKRGPALNAIIEINPRALERADELDARFAASGLTGPLHGIPMIVKDNYDFAGMATSAGSAALARSMPPDDAFQVRRILEAGAIVLAKSNMAEFAFSPNETLGSRLPGFTRNPYATNRVPAGSSGGTAAAVAASMGAVGLGTDTGNSIRGPSAHNALVGIRSTIGLTSRDGIVPLYFSHDIGGPMARSVADAVAVFDVLAGTDPADPTTAEADARRPDDYNEFLDADALAGARVGVVRQIVDRESGDPRVREVFHRALDDLRAAGAEVVDPVVIPMLDEGVQFWCSRFRADINTYLATLGPDAPVKTLTEIVASGDYDRTVRDRLRRSLEESLDDPDVRCAAQTANRQRFAEQVAGIIADQGLDALVFPTWANVPRLIGDLRSPGGDNSQVLSPQTGFPAITVPMGWIEEGGRQLPAGLQILGDAWSEPRLIAIAYAYEQATRHRRPPDTTPSLGSAAVAGLEGAWRAESYELSEGATHAVDGTIFFSASAWQVLYFVLDGDGVARRGSAEGGTYSLDGNRLTFRHRYNLSAGEEMEGLSAGELRMQIRDAAGEAVEPCTIEVAAGRLTIHFPSGNRMSFSRAS
jgi:Asp-tRNA(Asn)/Glu-tRNA(Gln) amidotransferase A subunit family amidase